jgi:hypothetical protein
MKIYRLVSSLFYGSKRRLKRVTRLRPVGLLIEHDKVGTLWNLLKLCKYWAKRRGKLNMLGENIRPLADARGR